MSISPLIMNAANMYCGGGPGAESLHLKLVQVKLPTMDEFYVDHHPGGAPVAIEIDMMIAKLECTFMILGMDGRIMKLMRPLQEFDTRFFIYGLLRDQLTGEYSQAQANITGRLGRVDASPYQRLDTIHTMFVIRGITSYGLYVSSGTTSDTIYEWDFFTNRLQIGNSSAAGGAAGGTET